MNYDFSNLKASNRRRQQRYASEFIVGVEFGQHDFCQSRAVDVSSTGLRLVSPHPLTQGATLNLTLCLDFSNVIELSGRAVWSQEAGNSGDVLVGIAFEDRGRCLEQLAVWLAANAA